MRVGQPRLGAFGLIAIVVAAGVVPSLVFAIVYAYTIDIPFWDDWNYAPLIVAAHSGHFLWGVAWAQHNEHRTFFMALLMAGLSRFAGWSELRETLFGVGIMTATLAVLWRTIVRTLPARSVPYVFLGISLLLFSLIQTEELFWGMGLGWLLANGFVIVAIYKLTQERIGGWDVAIALAACAVASYSVGAGLMSLPIGLLVILARAPANWRLAAGWIAGGTVIVSIFFYGYQSVPHIPLRGSEYLTVYPQYVLAYLGAPLGAWQGLLLAQILGVIALGVVSIGVVRFGALRRMGRDSTRYLPWLALCGFAIVNALTVAYGRAGMGAGQAQSSRYTTIAADGWIGILGLLVLFGADALRAGRLRARPLLVATLGLAVCFVFLIVESQFAGFAGMTAYTGRIEGGMLALYDSPHPTDTQLLLLYPDAGYVRERLAELAAVEDVQIGPYLW